MRDEIDARIWAEHGAQFSAAIDRLLKGAYHALCKLTAIQFAAPWRNRTGDC